MNKRSNILSGATSGNPVLFMAGRFLLLYLIIGFIIRVVLLATAPADASFGVINASLSLLLGLASDVSMGLLLLLPLAVMWLGLNDVKYGKRAGVAIMAVWLLCFAYSWLPQSIFKEYGGGVHWVARCFFGWKLASFVVRYFLPKIRMRWRRITLYATWAVYVFALLVVSVGEYLFWAEFGVRYNFIAVDYLIYTHEVIGNIMESYSIVPMVAVLVAATAMLLWLQSRGWRCATPRYGTWRQRCACLAVYAVLCVAGFACLRVTHDVKLGNQYAEQVGQNGSYDFLYAFKHNKLEYDKFYAMLPGDECKRLYRTLAGLDAHGEKQLGAAGQPALGMPNIVLITVESLSADFMARYGNGNSLTPRLDSLAKHGLALDSLYACGNRTVRGLEALSICMPPSAGESVVKQASNRMGGLAVGEALKRLGYKVQFFYGGDAYFDNMEDYFSKNGYEVVDRKQMSKGDITFANIWGVCDEDLFNKCLSAFESNASSCKPFFAHVMTTSNHRPYTYPAGKIRPVGKVNSRDNTVRYTDYAIGHFINQAASRKWFGNTVFVIVADHCASSAGKTSLPLDKYHIPCIVYSPKLIEPKAVETVCSQIDVMPTVLSLLHLNCKAEFAGQDIFSPAFTPRAFMATYQDLGYFENNKLTVLSPVRKVAQYAVRFRRNGAVDELPLKKLDDGLSRKAIAYYQYANMYQPKCK